MQHHYLSSNRFLDIYNHREYPYNMGLQFLTSNSKNTTAPRYAE